MGAAPEATVGQAPPPGHRPAPGPVPAGLRNLAGVGDVPGSQQPRPGALDAAGPVPEGSARRVLAGLRAVGGRAAASAWRATVNLAISVVLGGLFACGAAGALLLTAATVWIVGLGLTVRAGALQLGAQMGRLDRWRIERLSQIRIEPPPLPRAMPGAGPVDRQRAWAGSTWLWRLLGYQLVRLPVVGALAFGAVVWWWVTVVCFVLAAGQPAHLLGWRIGPLALAPALMAVLVVTGVAGLLAWPAVVRAVPAIDASLGRWLLGPSRASQLSTEVARLSQARSQAIAAAGAERRRIERDLHDGLQPQLVNLGLDLGLARARLRSDPGAAQPLIERAHQEAKRAAEDLRNLVRGIHPSVLDERGLDAALPALVASCTVPVAVNVRLARRPAPAPEAAAYYVAAEAITNISRHARASKAAVTISDAGGALRVAVEDDGPGGARIEPGGGLEGLAARVASLDGTFELSSPEGGPTRIEAVIPCAP
jgi:signal transduction histidine kinase